MERTKIRPSDNIRTFYLARFFMEYLLRTRRQESEAATKRQEKGIVDDPETAAKRMMPLGLVGEMAEMDSIRWVVMRMKFSMDERVCLTRDDEADGSHLLGLNSKLVSTVLPRS
jgi:replication fork protection complex subunit Tof1/Swi1